MKRLLIPTTLIYGLAALPTTPAGAQLQPTPSLSLDPAAGEVSLEWWAAPGCYYFIAHTADLHQQPFDYLPHASLGTGAPAVAVFEAGEATRAFFRIDYTDDPDSPLLTADFDDDRIANKAEIDRALDPFSAASADGDALPDDWETYWMATTALLGGDDFDGDGVTNGAEFEGGLSPAMADSDDDGLSDADDPEPADATAPGGPSFLDPPTGGTGIALEVNSAWQR